MANFVYIGGVPVDPTRVVAVERAVWSSEAQDYGAILVFDGGARVPVALYMKQAIAEIEELTRVAYG